MRANRTNQTVTGTLETVVHNKSHGRGELTVTVDGRSTIIRTRRLNADPEDADSLARAHASSALAREALKLIGHRVEIVIDYETGGLEKIVTSINDLGEVDAA